MAFHDKAKKVDLWNIAKTLSAGQCVRRKWGGAG